MFGRGSNRRESAKRSEGRSAGGASAADEGVNEALKAENALLWVQEMNNCKSAAEEIVLREVVYQ